MERLALGRFLSAFPPDSENHLAMDGHALAAEVSRSFSVEVPQPLIDFWSKAGAGYFGDRTLYVFGTDASHLPRHSLCEWNQQSFWREVFPEPQEGGPLFFAETCLGEQVGVRFSAGGEVPLLFLPVLLCPG